MHSFSIYNLLPCENTTPTFQYLKLHCVTFYHINKIKYNRSFYYGGFYSSHKIKVLTVNSFSSLYGDVAILSPSLSSLAILILSIEHNGYYATTDCYIIMFDLLGPYNFQKSPILCQILSIFTIYTFSPFKMAKSPNQVYI